MKQNRHIAFFDEPFIIASYGDTRLA